MRKIRFWKLSGAGNDFVLVEKRGVRGVDARKLARRLCDRKNGIGADGLLILGLSSRTPVLGYLNADGSPAFCGNGTRCAALWLAKGKVGTRLVLKTSAGPVAAEVTGRERVRIRMPRPARIRLGLRLRALGRTWTAHALDVGVPHAVVEVPSLGTFPVVEVGRALRRHPAFKPGGANVDFISIGRKTVAIRTYEKGVEDETMACGTGAAASAVCAHLVHGQRPPVRLAARGGGLRVSWRGDDIRELWLEGPAKVVFNGTVRL